MNPLFAAIYDPIMQRTLERTFRSWRGELMAHADGDVLEVGAGTGANLPYYTQARRLVLCEPQAAMRRRLLALASKDPRAEVVNAAAQTLPFLDASFDVVVTTLVLCTVPDVAAALREFRRVLRPRGRIVFMEHVASSDAREFAWQKCFERPWRFLAADCRLTRRTNEDMERAGFQFETLVRERLPWAPVIIKPTIRGIARLT